MMADPPTYTESNEITGGSTMRAFLIRRSSISLAICGIAAVLMFYVVNYPAAVNTSASARQLPICVQRDQKAGVHQL